MKQFMITLVVLFLVSIATIGQTSPKQVAVTDTTTNTFEASDSASLKTISGNDFKHSDCSNYSLNKWHGLRFDTDCDGSLVAIIAIVCVFGMPALIVFIVMFFAYRNRKSKFKMIEKAIENNANIPENLLREYETQLNGYANGIRNISIGMGLTLFLWFLTYEFFLACIGLMMICIGIGEIITHYIQKKNRN